MRSSYLALAWLTLLFPAVSRGAEDAHASDGGETPDGGFVGGAAPASSDVRVLVTGSVLPSKVVHAAMGPAPARNATQLAEWSAAACKRIVQAYQASGYDYARAWFSLEEENLVWIHVDPGRMHVLFVGVGGMSAALFRLRLNLPNNVFYKPAVERTLQDLKNRYGLVNISYVVRELGQSQTTPFGPMVPDRLLQIYVVSRESLGWSLDSSVSATWGVVPSLSYKHASLLLDDDRLYARVEFALPYREYLAEEGPQLRWVHGVFDAGYRLPPRLQGLLALRLETSLNLSLYSRPDLAIKTYNLLRSTTVPGLVLVQPVWQLSLGAGIDVVNIFRVERESDPATVGPALGNPTSVRALFRFGANLDPRARVVHRNQRPWLHLQIDAASSNIQRWLLAGTLSGQVALSVGRHLFLIRGQGLLLAGDVRFRDEIALAGAYQRVFFGNKYWVHQATQVEAAYRLHVWRDGFALGIFHDASLFMDRSQSQHRMALVNAFGPSVHFLLLDALALDFYAGFGFSPVGFDQTITFALQTIF